MDESKEPSYPQADRSYVSREAETVIYHPAFPATNNPRVNEPKEAWVIERLEGERWVVTDAFGFESVAREFAAQTTVLENVEYRPRRYVPAEE